MTLSFDMDGFPSSTLPLPIPVTPDDVSVPDELSAAVHYRRKSASLLYNRRTRRVLLLRPDPRGGTRTLMNVPLWSVVNVETAEERLARQLRRRGADDATQRRAACRTGSASSAGGESVHPHSRSHTHSSAPFREGSAAPRLLFVHYYARRGAALPIRTVELSADGEAAARVVAAVLRDVYARGRRRLLFFVSPTSGSGNARRVCARHVLPLLHFSRHETEVIVTTHAGHCEAYIADPVHAIDGRFVVVTVGGDGMVHEAVNGVHRRRAAVGTAEMTSPLLATIAAGSACGMAKSLNVLSAWRGALALVHLDTCVMDLMLLQYSPREAEPNGAMRPATERGRDAYTQNGPSVATQPEMEGKEPASEMRERIAFMSVSFGVPNEIDKGSEKLRWMGNARFTAYAAYTLLRGFHSYKAKLRFLPWRGRRGQVLQKLRDEDPKPDTTLFPPCTMDSNCAHCGEHVQLAPASHYNSAQKGKPTSTRTTTAESWGRNETNHALRSDTNNASPPVSDTENETELGSQQIDFDDASLPWVTLDGDHYTIFVGNLRDAAQDMMVTPLAHMSDGAIDIVFAKGGEVKRGRWDFLKFFTSLESGGHMDLPFVGYVKAEALELTAVDSVLMADGELMPFKSVRVTSIRRAAEFVCGHK